MRHVARRSPSSIPRATAILLEQDLEGAEYLILGDDEIDARALEIEERCFQLIALQAPVAGDLRQLVAALQMIAEIERSADLVVNICKAARRIYGHDLDPKLRGVITKMGEQATQLCDPARSRPTSRATRPRPRRSTTWTPTSTASSGSSSRRSSRATPTGAIDLQVAVQLAVVARFYERIGDHAVNIGERVRYIVDGWMPEQLGAARASRAGSATSRPSTPPPSSGPASRRDVTPA